MEEIKIPFNMEYEFKDDLREHPVDKKGMEEGITYLLKGLESKGLDNIKKAKMLSMISVYERILRKLDESEKHVEEAAYLFFDQKDKRSFIVAKIRQAHTLHWKGNFTRAEKILREFLIKSSEDKILAEYKDFYYQHLGKCFFDQSMFSDARDYFLKALDIRLTKNSKELLDSTNFALKVVQQKIDPDPEECDEEEEFDPNKVI